MDGHGFLRVVREGFLPFLSNFGFQMGVPVASGKFYRVSFEGEGCVISIYYEPAEDYLLILILNNENGQVSDIDDRSKTLRLADLNRQYMPLVTKAGREKNEAFFDLVHVEDEEEKLLLKKAKELRLVLPLYLIRH